MARKHDCLPSSRFNYVKTAYEAGLKEENLTIYNKQPKIEDIALTKAIAIWAIYVIGQEFPEHRKLLYQIGTGIGCGIAIRNEYNIERHRNKN